MLPHPSPVTLEQMQLMEAFAQVTEPAIMEVSESVTVMGSHYDDRNLEDIKRLLSASIDMHTRCKVCPWQAMLRS